MKRGGPLKRDPAKNEAWRRRSKQLDRGSGPKRTSGPKRSTSKKRKRGVSPASPAQREKVAGAVSIVSEQGPCDPAHLWPRSLGGCDDPLCVVPLTREEHDAFDAGDLDIAGHLISAGCLREVQHALTHTNGSLLRLINRLTGKRWAPTEGGST